MHNLNRIQGAREANVVVKRKSKKLQKRSPQTGFKKDIGNLCACERIPRNSVPGSPVLSLFQGEIQHRVPGQLGKITLPFRLANKKTRGAKLMFRPGSWLAVISFPLLCRSVCGGVSCPDIGGVLMGHREDSKGTIIFLLMIILGVLHCLPALPTAAKMPGIKYRLTEVYVPETGPVEAVKAA
jgi:hypothetical protein